MIGQYLPNNNKNATVPILPKILQLNRALINTTAERMSVQCRRAVQVVHLFCAEPQR
jgi:hypothetical protein